MSSKCQCFVHNIPHGLDLFPHKEIIQAYTEAGLEFVFDSHATIQDRLWRHFYTMTTANVRIANQPIEQQISGVYGVSDGKGKQWLIIFVESAAVIS